jgi:uncharacterized protein YeaO (DUF488 family)
MFAEKSVYTPMSNDEGTRVLVMRTWPRGVSSGRIDVWLKELGPLPELLEGLSTRRLSWLQFEEAYLRQLQTRPESKEALAMLQDLARTGGRITLFCHERQPPCHRFVLLRWLTNATAPS